MTKKQISEAMRQIGRKGGKARVKNQTKEQRSDSARKAAEARWAAAKETANGQPE